MADGMGQALEQELAEARRRGRWLSDDERQQLELDRQALELEQQQDRQRLLLSLRQRWRLLVLLGVCLLLPPFWPLALGITTYLLFPRTTLRLGVVALALLVLLGVGLAALITALILWL